MEALFKAIDELTDDNDVIAQLMAVEAQGHDLHCVVGIAFETSATELQRWGVVASNVLTSRVEIGEFGDLLSSTNHPLLLPYLEPVDELYVAHRPKDPASVLGQLYDHHTKLLGRWYPFDRFTNHDPLQLLTDGYGLLATGPRCLINAFSKITDEHQMHSSVRRGNRERLWREGTWQDLPDVIAAVVLGTSFFIAESFKATRMT